MMTAHDRDRILAGERLAQATRLLREVLAMGSEARGGYKPLLDIIHAAEEIAEGLRETDVEKSADPASGALSPNWLGRQLKAVKEDAKTWPAWMKGGVAGEMEGAAPVPELHVNASLEFRELPDPLPNDEVKPSLSRWSDRLTWDHNISADSPVIRGTWVTVSHVVSLIIDGWTWSDVLRTHPELNADDLRVCLAYTVADANGDT